MHGLSQNNYVSILSLLERMRVLNSSYDSAVSTLFSVQQNQVDGLRKLGAVEAVPATAMGADKVQNLASPPEPNSIMDGFSRELDKFQNLTNVLESLLDDARFIDKALFQQTVMPEPQKVAQASQPMGASQATSQIGSGIDTPGGPRYIEYQPGPAMG